jgi:hypothetical protein
VKIARSVKNPNALVLASPFDLILPFSYYYNREYFEDVNDHRRYHRTETALGNEGIFFLKGDSDYVTKYRGKAPAIIYIGGGEKENDPDNPSIKEMEKDYSKHSRHALSNSYEIHVFRQ